jgi:hypothetical protein
MKRAHEEKPTASNLAARTAWAKLPARIRRPLFAYWLNTLSEERQLAVLAALARRGP